jgi:hypothetical protein
MHHIHINNHTFTTQGFVDKVENPLNKSNEKITLWQPNPKNHYNVEDPKYGQTLTIPL